MDNQRNLILAIVLSVLILFTFQALIDSPAPQKPKGGDASGASKAPAGAKGGGGPIGAGLVFNSREKQLAETRAERVPIETPAVTGSIWLKGAVIDDLTLKRYRQRVEKDSPPVNLLQPIGTRNAYFAAVGWIDAKTGQRIKATGDDGKPIDMLSAKWTLTKGKVLSPGNPVTLTATMGGLKFERTYEIDDNYLITVTQKVTNTTDKPVSLLPAGWVYRRGEPDSQGFLILHEGPTIMQLEDRETTGSKKEPEYSDLRETTAGLTYNTYGGWLGFREHYWMVVLIPPLKQSAKAYFAHDRATDVYRALYHLSDPVTVAPGQTSQAATKLFAGAKKYDILVNYRDRLGVPRFEWAIDFGRLWFITEPFLRVLIWLFGLVGNFGVAILLLTVMVKIAFFWFSHRAYKSMNKMKALAPEMKALREKYKDDKQRMNQELMAMYRKEKVNPAAGCLPILVQIPVFFALYVTLFIALDMRHAPFFGWIQDLSAQDPTSILNLFGLLPYEAPKEGLVGLISIGIWPIIMGGTMYLQQKMNPPPADPMQQRIFMLLPFIFTFMLATFPAGLVVYWAWNNVLSIAQQWAIGRLQAKEKNKSKSKAITNVKDKPVTQGANGGDAPAPEDAPSDGGSKGTKSKPGNSKRPAGKKPLPKGNPPRGRGRSRGNRGGGKGRSRGKR